MDILRVYVYTNWIAIKVGKPNDFFSSCRLYFTLEYDGITGGIFYFQFKVPDLNDGLISIW